jgi:hypothetical protein
VRFGAIDRTTGENVRQATGVSLGMLKDETIQGQEHSPAERHFPARDCGEPWQGAGNLRGPLARPPKALS